MRTDETPADDGASLRGALPFVAVSWTLMGVYDVAVVEMMRPYISLAGSPLEQTWARFVNHMVLLPVAVAACGLLLVMVRRGVSWLWIALSTLVLSLAVGVFERASLMTIGSWFGDAPKPIPLDRLFDDEYRAQFTYSFRAALKHSEGFLVAALVVLARHEVLRALAALHDRNQAREAGLRARLAALQNELSPHFMFNALHHAVAQVRDDGVRTMLVDLSELLRYVLRGRGQPSSTVAEEIEFSRGYLDLCAVQGVQVVTRWDVAEDAARAELPRMLLHMLIENAYRHAAEVQPQGTIAVKVALEGGALVINTDNDFLPGTTVAGTGIGLKNIRERLGILYGERFALESGAIASGRWHTTLRLPVERSR